MLGGCMWGEMGWDFDYVFVRKYDVLGSSIAV